MKKKPPETCCKISKFSWREHTPRPSYFEFLTALPSDKKIPYKILTGINNILYLRILILAH